MFLQSFSSPLKNTLWYAVGISYSCRILSWQFHYQISPLVPILPGEDLWQRLSGRVDGPPPRQVQCPATDGSSHYNLRIPFVFKAENRIPDMVSAEVEVLEGHGWRNVSCAQKFHSFFPLGVQWMRWLMFFGELLICCAWSACEQKKQVH